MSTASVELVGHGPGHARPASGPTVVLCDDEAAIRKMYRRAIRSAGVDVLDAPDGESCLDLVDAHRPELVVLDLTLPGRSGFEVLPEILARAPEVRVVVVSGLVTPTIAEEALDLGAFACVEKVRFVPLLRTMVTELVR